MKIFLHIGDARTGTSTLQAVLFHNRLRLREMGVEYPIVGTREGKGIAHHKLSFSLLPEWPRHALIEPVPAEEIWNALNDQLNGLDAQSVILSSEAFLNLPEPSIAFVKATLKDHDVTPICVRRDPEDWRRSWIAHRIRQGEVVSPPARPARDLAGPKIARWSAQFDVVTVPYYKTVLADVLAAMDLDLARLETLSRRNESCPDAVLQCLNRLNAMDLIEANRGAFLAVLKEFPGAEGVLDGVVLDAIDRVSFNQKIVDALTS